MMLAPHKNECRRAVDICACGNRKLTEQCICAQCETRASRPHQAVSDLRTYYEVLWCPHGEFEIGNRFPLTHFPPGLDIGTWALGMVVARMPEGEKFVVCGDGKAYRRPADTLPRQRLVAVNGRCRV